MSRSPSPSARPTLADVAAAAEVSISTASLAFSGAKPVSEGTRQRVLGAADDLGYSGPDPMARSLREGRTGIVGALVGERLLHAFRDPVEIALLDGLSEELGADGKGLLLLAGHSGHPGSTGPDQLDRAPLDALVFANCGAESEPSLGQLRRRGVPLVGVEGPHEPDVCLVDIDHRGASAALTRHLLELGHRDVTVVTLPMVLDGRRGPVDDARRRENGYTGCRERLLGVEEALGRSPAAWEASSHLFDEGRRAGAAVLDVAPSVRPTAVVAQSDLLAAGVIAAARELGLRVPDDVSVAGFDGIDTPWLGGVTLTTAAQPMVEKGRVAGRMVAALLGGEHPADVVLPVDLRIGTSTAPVR